MILAAGRGERMRPLTDALPKPLLRAGGKALIEYHLMNLAKSGFADVVINHAWLGKVIEDALGNGDQYGLTIHYSRESSGLETAGGIANARTLLTGAEGRQPFFVVNGDIYCEYDFSRLLPLLARMQAGPDQMLAHLVLVDNPAHHTAGDFSLDAGRVISASQHSLTFSGIGLYQPALFDGITPGTPARLAPLLHQAIADQRISGEYYQGMWMDVGTPDRLYFLDEQLNKT